MLRLDWWRGTAVLYCTVLYCTVLYCTVPYCTLLHLAGAQLGLLRLGAGHRLGVRLLLLALVLLREYVPAENI